MRQRSVAVWLFICCGLVFAMVVLGGVTRLTGSGLSMVEWRPVLGVLPPLNETQWQQVLDLYKQSPEFQLVNSDMTVEGFKGIFWLEYLHRLLGRAIGLVFLFPFLVFLWRGHIDRADMLKYVVMFILGGLQGLLGWYMVKSGLVSAPHVSQYRLAAHLMAAVAIYGYMLWVAFSLWHSPRNGAKRHPWFGKSALIIVLLLATMTSGAFVAGLKAGLAYNTFPLMGGRWIPMGLLALEPGWRNLFENLVLVQFNHRLLAMAAFLAVIVYWALGTIRAGLPKPLRNSAHVLLATALVQVALGISTLLLKVPVVLASLHQAVALVLFTVALYLTHQLTLYQTDNQPIDHSGETS